MLGTLGEVSILAAFVACLVAVYAYARATLRPHEAAVYAPMGKTAWSVMGVGVLVASAVLWALLFGQEYQYSYVYHQTSSAMPLRYQFSAFWAGQEGSFLLWIGLSAGAGSLVAAWAGTRADTDRLDEPRLTLGPPAMAVLGIGQAFLLSMVLGIDLFGLNVGASPFLTLAERYPDAPVLQQAGYVPPDGQGLNDLLQNPWMTIHPPTLFVGFTLMAVPFAFAVAGLWTRRYTDWVRPALPWTLAGLGVLGLGIMMGGYWAYVTLSFGGWWAWDPVENASLVPWIIGVAALHAMLVQKKTAAGHKSALLLTVAAYAFVVYSTFLTRSGILGDISVHSFVDLGLYNQLLLYILTIVGLGAGMFAWRYRELPRPAQPSPTMSREGLIFQGALLLALTGLVIALGTSAPIFGRIFRDNPAAVPISFYSSWTLPLAIGVALLAGVGQLMWWKRMSAVELNRALAAPLGLAVASTAAILIFTPFVAVTVQPGAPQVGQELVQAGLLDGLGPFWDRFGMSLMLMLLLLAAFFSFYGNTAVMWRIGRGNARLVGGSLSHVGFAILLLGIVISGAFNNPISDGDGANIQGSRDNFILARGETKQVDGYTASYHGSELNELGRPVYRVDFTSPSGDTFEARTEVYQSAGGQWIQHPDVQQGAGRDVYVALYPSVMSEGPQDPDSPPRRGGEPEEITLVRGQAIPLGNNDYRLTFRDYDLNVDPAAVEIDAANTELAVAAVLELEHLPTRETRTLRPVYIILKDGSQEFVQNRVTDWDITATFVGMQVDEGAGQGAVRIVLDGIQVLPDDWVVVQAYEKPLISLVWLGTLVLLAGFAVSGRRRFADLAGRSRMAVA